MAALMGALIAGAVVLWLLILVGAPIEYAARHSERFAAFLDETVRRVFG